MALESKFENEPKSPERKFFSEEQIVVHLMKYGLVEGRKVKTDWFYLNSSGNIITTKNIEVEVMDICQAIKDFQGQKQNEIPVEVSDGEYKYTFSEIKNSLNEFNLPEQVLSCVGHAIRLLQSNESKKILVKDVVYVQDVAVGGDQKKPDNPHEVPVNKTETELTEEKVVEYLLAKSKFIHFASDSWGGNSLKKAFVGGKTEEIFSKDLAVFKVIADPSQFNPWHSLGTEVSGLLINSFQQKSLEFFPVIRNFNSGQGYGLVCGIYDSEGGARPGAAAYWVIVPKEEGKIKEFIKNNPSVLFKIFKDKFYQELECFKSQKNQREIVLSEKEFIDTDAR